MHKVFLLLEHFFLLSLFVLYLLLEESGLLLSLLSLPLLLPCDILLLRFQDEQALADANGLFNVPLVVLAGLHNDGTHVVNLRHQL